MRIRLPPKPKMRWSLPRARSSAYPNSLAPDVPLPPEDARPVAWRSPTAVMCIGGRRALDEGPAAMLAQLLQKHGLGAHVVAREELSRTRIASFDGRGAQIVCISYLEIAGLPFQLRYMVRRIRSRLPGAQIVAGYWATDDPVLGRRRKASVRWRRLLCALAARGRDHVSGNRTESHSGVRVLHHTH